MSSSNDIINCLIEGEILKVSEDSGTKGKSQILYTVMARFPNGAQNILSRVPVATMFGGIGDYFQFKLRGTFDDDDNSPSDSQFFQDESRRATLGDRVLISFLGGHITRPFIVGYMPHPNTNWLNEDHQDLSPQATLTYLGVSMNWSDTGAFQLIKRGAPDVSYNPKTAPLMPAIPLGDEDPTLPPDHVALEPADDTEVIRMAFLDDGIFRLNDSEGQMVELDHNKGQILISNNGLKSTEVPGSAISVSKEPDAEYVLFDSNDEKLLASARSILQLYSGDARTDETTGDYTSEVHGNLTWTVDGDVEETFKGSHTHSVEGSLDQSIKEDWSITVSGAATVSVKGDYSEAVEGALDQSVKSDYSLSVEGAASTTTKGDSTLESANFVVTAKEKVEITGSQSVLTLSQGKVSIKGATGEVIDLLSQLLQAIAQMTVPTGVGPSGPPINASAFAQIQTKLDGMKM
ncbi:hypothetical protein UFOVP244_175 [uncultured Caudovirales phage]|uniref:Gp5/Type VI secretion system Vgr protein OB-fold domain-containing protein n=1 Tax=uncultured Caudovirales phage TaxID=2100421 RepID=A0A6J7WUN6_9CAUD|nr:hypothetical protein UFOVP244_175 [uncultured Caudovirales phage]